MRSYYGAKSVINQYNAENLAGVDSLSDFEVDKVSQKTLINFRPTTTSNISRTPDRSKESKSPKTRSPVLKMKAFPPVVIEKV